MFADSVSGMHGKFEECLTRFLGLTSVMDLEVESHPIQVQEPL